MRSLKSLFFFALFSAIRVFGQGSTLTGSPVVSNGVGQPMAGATVAICSVNPGVFPTQLCSGPSLVTTYTDSTVTVPCTGTLTALNNQGAPSVGSGCSNPGLTDGQGNAVAFAPPSTGMFWCEYTGSNVEGIAVSVCLFPSGGGFTSVQINPTPAINQLALWLSGTLVQGLPTLTFDGTTFATTGSGGIASPSFNTVGFGAGIQSWTQGPDMSSRCTVNSYCLQAPALIFNTWTVTTEQAGPSRQSIEQFSAATGINNVSTKTYVPASTLWNSKAGSTSSATPTNMFSVPVAASQSIGVQIIVHVETTQATPQNCSTTEVFVASVQNTAATITSGTTTGTLATICSTGTLTLAAAFSSANPSVFSVTPSWTTIVPTGVTITVEIHNLSLQDVSLL